MSIGSKLKVESKGMFATFIFYAIIGIVFLVWLPMADFAPHLALIGIFSLITAYGLIRKQTWTTWLILILFLGATTFSVFMISYVLTSDLILASGMIVYLVLTWVFTIYALMNRKTLGS